MSNWSLETLLASLHDDIEQRLATARRALGHSVAKGDASQAIWVRLLSEYLPQRYRVASAHVVDSNGAFSEQIDVLVFDRQYSPFIFQYEGQTVVPAESVYAAFEAKQTINAALVAYARAKVASVRRLERTSLPIPHAGGTYKPKPLSSILGGVLALESDWKPALGDPLRAALEQDGPESRLNLGCIAAQGIFGSSDEGGYTFASHGKPATAFLFELIARLQACATVPMIDVRAYAKWLL